MNQDIYIETRDGFYQCNVTEEKDIIGVGSFANIYKGLYKQKASTESTKPVEVAIKYLNSFHIEKLNVDTDLQQEPDHPISHSLLMDEVKIMESLKSQDVAVLQLLDYDIDKINDHVKCIILEKANCTLADLLYHHTYSDIFDSQSHTATTCSFLTIQLSWLIDCFEGLNFIHSNNIIHHDIKPDNIFYFASPYGSTGIGRMKIGDFGLSHTSHIHSHAICTALKTNEAVKKICQQKPASPKSPSCHHTKKATHVFNQLNNNNNTNKSNSNKGSTNHPHKPILSESDISPTIDPCAICKGQSVYQPPELFFYPPKCTFSGLNCVVT